MPEVPRQPVTRESVEALLSALELCGGDFVRFGALGERVREAHAPEELAGLALPLPAPDLLRHADTLRRLEALWTVFGRTLSPWGLGLDEALASVRRRAAIGFTDRVLGEVTEDELRVLDALAPRIGTALSPFRTATMQKIADNLEAEAGSETAREAAQQIGDDDPEARQWLRANGQKGPLAANRFDAEEALAFVEALYAAGAERVVVPRDSICDDEQERSLGGPYADALKVRLPTDPSRRAAIFAIAEREALDEGFDPDTDTGQDVLLFWWD